MQSLDDAALAQLGRLHSAREALDAVAVARDTFARFSFDLIYARPEQTPDAWRGELRRALEQEPEHLSLYQLTIESDTPFATLYAAGKLPIPDHDAARALYEITQESCATRVAARTRRHPQTVLDWLDQYNTRGPAALVYQRTGGRPPFARISRLALARSSGPPSAPLRRRR